jgi:hypothetical protein
LGYAQLVQNHGSTETSSVVAQADANLSHLGNLPQSKIDKYICSSVETGGPAASCSILMG